jgi:hypothetical protein
VRVDLPRLMRQVPLEMDAMQVDSDWSTMGTPEHLEQELNGFKFSGPGFYLTKTDTLLVAPLAPQSDPWQWRSDMSPTAFRAYVYNCQFADTIFSRIAVAPVRSDTR